MQIINIIEKTYISLKSVLRVIYVLITHSFDRIAPEAYNEKLLILCNGNSLNDVINNQSESHHYMVVNYFCLSETYTSIRPKYYVLADPAFYTDENALAALHKLNMNTSWEMTLYLVNCDSSPKINSILTNPHIKVRYINGTSVRGFDWMRYFFYNKQIAMPTVQNVLVACLMISIHLRYKIVELYGVDHSWLKYLTVHEDNKTYMIDTHFYDTEEIREVEFVPNGYKYHEIIDMFSRMFKSYHDIVQYIDACKIPVHIVNMCKDSFIDAFEKK